MISGLNVNFWEPVRDRCSGVSPYRPVDRYPDHPVRELE